MVQDFLVQCLVIVAGSPKWMDIPFTREESLQADKTFKLNCKCTSYIYDVGALYSNSALYYHDFGLRAGYQYTCRIIFFSP